MSFLPAIALAFAATVPVLKDEPKDAQAALQGQWKMVEFIREGVPQGKDRLGTVTIKGDKLTINNGKRDEVASFTLDPKARPAAIDIKPGRPGGKVELIKGIYKLEKDKLTICFGMDGTDRPKEFKSVKDGKTGLFVLERVKK